jgi:hypothetical protein
MKMSWQFLGVRTSSLGLAVEVAISDLLRVAKIQRSPK